MIMSFGSTIANARKAKGLSQKELAAHIIKEDGKPISPQYLNDIERDRRNAPSDHILQRLAEALDLPADRLYFLAGQIPSDIRSAIVDEAAIDEAFSAFRKRLRG
jgi:transcriptional regulator with XRE-family HTH domain